MRKKRPSKKKPTTVKKKFYKKRYTKTNTDRNWEDPQYKKWRQDVKNRDKRKCRFPGCECTKRLQVHHIKKWSEYPTLRYEITNGITLCAKCHKLVTGNEVYYEEFFRKILEWDLIAELKRRLREKGEDLDG